MTNVCLGRLEVVPPRPACGPTADATERKEGIAAANIELQGSEVCVITIHSLFDLDGDTYNTKLDFAEKSHKVQVLVGLDIRGKRARSFPSSFPAALQRTRTSHCCFDALCSFVSPTRTYCYSMSIL